MDQGIKARWVAKLREPGRRQTWGRLRDDTGAQCCLDVLCEVAIEDGILSPPQFFKSANKYGYVTKSGVVEFGVLPDEVYKWAGLDISDVYIRVSEFDSAAATELNDDMDWDFLRIADAIENDESL